MYSGFVWVGRLEYFFFEELADYGLCGYVRERSKMAVVVVGCCVV